MDARFDSLWREKLEPWLAGLEQERRQAVRRLFIGLGAGAVLGPLAGFALGVQLEEPGLVLMGLFLGLAIGGGFGYQRLRGLRKQVKVRLNEGVAEVLDLRYALKPPTPRRFDTFCDLGLLPSWDRHSFEDHFEGERQGCDFELYEAHLEEKRRSKNGTHYVTVFRGVLIRINFPRKVEGVTVITRDQGIFNGLEAFGRSFGKTKLERIRLVDPDFEKAFEVYGNDQVLARYMLTPSFMERLIALEAALKGKNVRAAFDQDSGEGELLISAETGNQFEAGSMFKPLADASRVERLVDELSRVIALLDLLVEPAKFGEDSLVEAKD